MRLIDSIETVFMPIAAMKENGLPNGWQTKFTPTIALLPAR